MGRLQDGLLIRVWASTPEAGTLDTPEDQGLTRAVGWGARYKVDLYPQLEVFNQLYHELTTFAVDVENHGVLEWDAEGTYVHPAICYGSDGVLYKSVQDSGGSNTVQDPTADTGGTYWGALIPSGLEVATSGQVEAGSSVELIVTPGRLLAALFKGNVNARWRATAARYGLVRVGSLAEIQGGNADRIVTGETLVSFLNAAVPNASTTTRGKVELATAAEARASSDSSRAVTPSGLSQFVQGGTEVRRIVALTQSEYDALANPVATTLYLITG